jgi:hypothetical protein
MTSSFSDKCEARGGTAVPPLRGQMNMTFSAMISVP